jgi:hypothetical protein
MKIVTNHVPRDVIYGSELTVRERREFDFLGSEELETSEFFRYRGEVYYLRDFMYATPELRKLGWDGFLSDTFFSGVLIKYADEYGDSVIVGRYFD